MKRLLSTAIVLASVTAWAGADLVLVDETVLRGVSVERDEDHYLLELEGGEIVTVPVALVDEVRLFEGEEPEEPDPPAPSGFVVTEGEELVGPTDPARADDKPSYPKVGQQLGVFGDPSRFQRGATNPFWQPESDWDLDPAQNDFNPARWYDSSLNPYWEPTSAYDADVDVLAPRRTRWRSSVTSPYWFPSDGFATSGLFD